MASVLLIDDEPKILSGLRLLLKPHFRVITTTEPEEVFRVLQSETVEVLVSDQRMPSMAGIEVLRRAKAMSPQTVRVLLTGYADLNAVIDAVNEGEVYRYLQKPWDNHLLVQQIIEASNTSKQLQDDPGRSLPHMDVMETESVPPAEVLPPESALGRPLPVLAVYDRDPSTERALRMLTEAGWLNCEKIWCESIEELCEALVDENVSVLLADFSQEEVNLQRLLRLVKKEAPAVQTLLASRHHDLEAVTKLVNHVRPFRFLTKPLDRHLNTLSVYLSAGFAKHRSLSKNSILTAEVKGDGDAQIGERMPTFFGALGAAFLRRFFRSAGTTR